MQATNFPTAPHLSKPRENFRSKRFETSERKFTPLKSTNTPSFVEDTPPTKAKKVDKTFLTEQRLYTQDKTDQHYTPIKQAISQPKNDSLKIFEAMLSCINLNSAKKEVLPPHAPQLTPSFIRKSVKNSGIKSEEKVTGLSTTLDTSSEDSKPNCKLHFSHCKESKISEFRPEIPSFDNQGLEPPFRRRRFASVDSIIKKRTLSKSRRESKNYQILSLNRIIQEDSDEASTQRGGREKEKENFRGDQDNDSVAEKEWRFVLSNSEIESRVYEDYEKELQNIDKEIVEFIKMGIARKGLLLGKLSSEKRKDHKTLEEEMTKMKKFIENTITSFHEAKGLAMNERP